MVRAPIPVPNHWCPEAADIAALGVGYLGQARNHTYTNCANVGIYHLTVKLFRLGWPKEGRSGLLDLGYDLHLPWIKCETCNRTWGDGMIEYPAIQFDFLVREEFNDDRIVNATEFKHICARLESALGRRMMFVPGASMGILSGNAATPKLGDFVWGRHIYPQISRRARDLLAQDGVALQTAEASIRFRGRLVESHLAIQAEPAALLTPESRRSESISHCSSCNDFRSPPRKRDHVRRLVAVSARWPVGHHLVIVLETLDLVASSEFMDSVRRHSLSGIEFEECGEIVP